MPILSRRNLQRMLDELGPWLTKGKATDLLRRMESVDPDQAIPAEYELALAWGLSKFTELELEPKNNSRAPDMLTTGLLPEAPALIEVVAISDDTISGKTSMNRTANIVNQYADTQVKKASNDLYYTFFETSGYKPVKLREALGPWTHRSQYYRERLTNPEFKLSEKNKRLIGEWLEEWPPKSPIRITDIGTVFQIEWKEKVHPQLRVFSSMPSLIHDLRDNPIFTRLKEKSRQLAGAPDGHVRCIFLGDAGCNLLKDLSRSDPTHRFVSGRAIIEEFLRSTNSVDIVCVFSPQRENENTHRLDNNPRHWRLTIIDKFVRPEEFHAGLERLRSLLPQPYLHAYQARSWMEQGMLDPQARGQYLPMNYSWGGRPGMRAKISSRALLELLAGRMDAAGFKRWITGDRNQFEHMLKAGCSISEISMEAAGVDRDDDYIVINLEPDPNASAFRLPPQLLEDSGTGS